MRLEFDEKGYNYIEFKKAKNSKKDIAIVLSSKDNKNPLSAITNSVEITNEEFLELISDLGLSSEPS